jgi:tetratricopeptide (TPR) repeat protein
LSLIGTEKLTPFISNKQKHCTMHKFIEYRHFTLILLVFITFVGCKKKTDDQNQVQKTGNAKLDRLNAQIEKSPKNADLYYARAEQYFELEGFDEAIADLNKAISIDSSKVDYYHLLADAYMDYFKSFKALKTLETAVMRFPRRIPTMLKLSEFQMILQMHKESMKTIDQVLQIDPQNAEAFFMFGMNFKEMGDTARAINSFQTAVENDPELVDAWINLGQLHAALGNAIAGRYFETATRIDPKNIEALHARGYYQQSIGDLKGSLATFRKINRIDPKYAEGYFNAGLLLMDMDSIPAAYEKFDAAIKASPVHIQAFFYRGVAAEILGKKQQAKADYEQALKLAPDYTKAKEGLERVR